MSEPVRGLLSRLAQGHRKADVVDSVIANLQLLLNTRVGDASAVPDFGIMDFTELVHDVPKSIPNIQTSIRNTIARYEPRLQNVNVRFVPSEEPLSLSFEISGRLVDEKKRVVRLQTRMKAGGRFDVE